MSEDLERELLQAVRELTAAVKGLRRLSAAETLSIEEAAAELGCSESRVYQLLRAGKLKRAKKAGRHTRVVTSSVRSYQGLEAAKVTPATKQDDDGVARGSRFRELAKKSSGT